MEYSLLVLPIFDRMTPKLLDKIRNLVKDGATLIGLPPVSAPGLTDYPACDEHLKEQAQELWGGTTAPQGLVAHHYGKGQIYWGSDIRKNEDNLYPHYQLTSQLLKEKMNIEEDFHSEGNKIRYIHKRIGKADVYFVANRTKEVVNTVCTFRVTGKQPRLWNPVDGKIRTLPAFTNNGISSSLEMTFEPNESFFVVFAGKASKPSTTKKNFCSRQEIQNLKGPWAVAFDPTWGGPAQAQFPELQDWSKHVDEGIRYYSGTAVYTKHFTFASPSRSRFFLDLGCVKNIAKVTLNGHDLGILWVQPWRVEITDALRKGKNTLSVEVTNLWPNRLIGDEKKQKNGIGKKQYTFSTFRHYTPGSPLLESGLLGPVRLLKTEK